MKKTDIQLRCESIIRESLFILKEQGHLSQENIKEIDDIIRKGNSVKTQKTSVKINVDSKPIKKSFHGINIIK